MILTVTVVVASAILAIRPVVGHCKVVRTAPILPPNGVFDRPISWGMGVNIENKFPWFMSQGGDAGPDAPVFGPEIAWYPNPEHPCGTTEEWGPLNIPAWLGKAEAMGVAEIGADGTFESEIFQVNRDGGGQCTCELNTDATATSWEKCKTLINPPGFDGMIQLDRVNHTAKFQLPPRTVCTGGIFEDKCIVRIRCGWKLRFGGCVVIRTVDSPAPKALKVVGADDKEADDITLTGTVTGSVIDSVVQQVFDAMQSRGILVPARRTCGKERTGGSHMENGNTNMKRALNLDLPEQIIQHSQEVSQKVVEMIKKQNLLLIPTA